MISVIMPVYNSEKFLAAAIESVLKQTFKDFELLLIDDGSADKSGKICDTYAYLDNRIKVIHQQNGGICAARNTGLKNAKGEYIAFIDNDDLFEKHLLEDNYKLASEYDADIVCFGVGNFEDENKMSDFSNDVKSENCYNKEYIKTHYFQLRTEHFANIWNKLFSNSVINQYSIKFQESFRYGYEDYMFNVENLFGAEKIVINTKRYYSHFARLGHSTSLKYNFNRVESLIKGAEIEIPECENIGIGVNDIAGVCAFYIKIISRELYGKDKDLTNKQKKMLLNKLPFDVETYGSADAVKYIYRNDKIASITWKLYCMHNFGLLRIVILLWKLRAKLGKRYF